MHFPRILVAALSSAILCTTASSQAILPPIVMHPGDPAPLPAQKTDDETSDAVNPAGDMRGLITVTLPQAMRFCGGRCSLLRLNNGHYDGYQEDNPNVLSSTFKVYRFTPESVIMTLTQSKGGANGILKGRMSPDKTSLVDPIFTWTNVPFGSGLFHMSWGSALAAAKPVSPGEASAFLATGQSLDGHITAALPAVIRTCGVNCFRLRLNNGHYEASAETDPDGTIKSIYTVLEFKPESVILHRSDIGGGESVLTGHISSSGDSIAGGKIKSHDANYGAFPYQMTWGNSLTAATRFGAPLYGPKCVTSAPLTEATDVAYQNGLEAWKRRDFAQTYCWATKSAERGNARSRTLLGVLYSDGDGVEMNATTAFENFKLAAESGDPMGEYLLAKCYRDGAGVAGSPERAALWLAKTNETEEGRNIVAANEIKTAHKQADDAQQPEGNPLMLGIMNWLLSPETEEDRCARIRETEAGKIHPNYHGCSHF